MEAIAKEEYVAAYYNSDSKEWDVCLHDEDGIKLRVIDSFKDKEKAMRLSLHLNYASFYETGF